MKSKLILLVMMILSGVLLAACGGGGAFENKLANNATNKSEVPTNSNNAAPKPPEVTLKPGEVPFEGFSNVKTTAKSGEWVLSFGDSKAKEINAAPSTETALFYNYKISQPGDVESELEETGGKKYKIPNAYVIPLPKGQKAKVGDTVLTWWQSGGGMFRAYVVEASNPAEPTVRYLGMSGKDVENKQDKLKPDSFVVLKDGALQPGMNVSYKDGDRSKMARIVFVNGDKVLVEPVERTLKVMNKADLTPVPLKLALKPGDKVKAGIFGTFNDATVVSVDDKLGKAVVKRETPAEEKSVDFGEISNK